MMVCWAITLVLLFVYRFVSHLPPIRLLRALPHTCMDQIVNSHADFP